MTIESCAFSGVSRKLKKAIGTMLLMAPLGIVATKVGRRAVGSSRDDQRDDFSFHVTDARHPWAKEGRGPWDGPALLVIFYFARLVGARDGNCSLRARRENVATQHS